MSNERRYGIGYALAPKKKNSFIQRSLIELARERGIDLICIDSDKPLVDQGPFDCILHKLSGEEWKNQLKEFTLRYPNVFIIDRPEAIERLHNRISMLQVVSELRVTEGDGVETFGIPKQIVVYKAEALNDFKTSVGLKFPVIAKPLVADGSVKSHKMSLVFNSEGLLKLKPPLVLQQFVNHGGVIFKVYVVGDYVKCVKRKSLPDVQEDKLGSSQGSMSFCHVSNVTHGQQNEGYYEVMQLEDAELPPARFIAKIAEGLRKALGLHLFNFDVIRDTKKGNHYLVIDINYFPGYAKMPDYESVLTDFFYGIFHGKKRLEGCEDGDLDHSRSAFAKDGLVVEDGNLNCARSVAANNEDLVVEQTVDADISSTAIKEESYCDKVVDMGGGLREIFGREEAVSMETLCNAENGLSEMLAKAEDNSRETLSKSEDNLRKTIPKAKDILRESFSKAEGTLNINGEEVVSHINANSNVSSQ